MEENKGTVWSKLLDEHGYETQHYEWLTPEAAKKNYPLLFYTYKSLFTCFNDEAIAQMVAVATDVCPHCYDTFGRCGCIMDD